MSDADQPHCPTCGVLNTRFVDGRWQCLVCNVRWDSASSNADQPHETKWTDGKTHPCSNCAHPQYMHGHEGGCCALITTDPPYGRCGCPRFAFSSPAAPDGGGEDIGRRIIDEIGVVLALHLPQTVWEPVFGALRDRLQPMFAAHAQDRARLERELEEARDWKVEAQRTLTETMAAWEADRERTAQLEAALKAIRERGHAQNCPAVLWKDGRCRCVYDIALATLALAPAPKTGHEHHGHCAECGACLRASYDEHDRWFMVNMDGTRHEHQGDLALYTSTEGRGLRR